MDGLPKFGKRISCLSVLLTHIPWSSAIGRQCPVNAQNTQQQWGPDSFRLFDMSFVFRVSGVASVLSAMLSTDILRSLSRISSSITSACHVLHKNSQQPQSCSHWTRDAVLFLSFERYTFLNGTYAVISFQRFTICRSVTCTPISMCHHYCDYRMFIQFWTQQSDVRELNQQPQISSVLGS